MVWSSLLCQIKIAFRYDNEGSARQLGMFGFHCVGNGKSL